MEKRSSRSSNDEEISSDFFDDFSKEEFIQGLSVVDAWDDMDKKPIGRTRINADDLGKVEDLRNLIAREKAIETDGRIWRPSHSKSSAERRSSSTSRMDGYIKPGSRRDPYKTNKAIKKDKEEKVKEYLAKHLESNDDIRPPGTELDDFFEAKKEVKRQPSETKTSMVLQPSEHVKNRREPPTKYREAPQNRKQYWNQRRPIFSPRPRLSPRRSPRRYSPRRSPRRYSPRHSPNRNFRRIQRTSPRRSSPELHRRKSRSPKKPLFRRSRSRSTNYRDREIRRRSRSRSRNLRSKEDDFLYPKNYYPPEYTTAPTNTYPGSPAPPVPQYTEPMIVEFPGEVPLGYPYPQTTPYSSYQAPYEYGSQPVVPGVMPAPQPVPAPIISPDYPAAVGMAPGVSGMVPGISPAMVTAPQPVPTPMPMNQSLTPRSTESVQTSPTDALAKLVADGILSQEDYLKLAPNKGVSHFMDTQSRVQVLNRCNCALSRIGSIQNVAVPKRFTIINNMLTAADQNHTPSKYCSPLKRQLAMDFYFKKSDASTVCQRNKQIIEALIENLQLENVIGKPKKHQKDKKDAETQTTKPFCDMCEIRESTNFNEIGTSIDLEHIFSSVQTQVVEHDLISSKAVFNPSGCVSEGTPISIAHLTPAQLVSQLAARAKSFKQTDSDTRTSNQFKNSHGGYDGRGGGNQYQHQGNNSNNYRY